MTRRVAAPAITFHAHGWPGVRLRDIPKYTVVVDSPNDPVFAPHVWSSAVVNVYVRTCCSSMGRFVAETALVEGLDMIVVPLASRCLSG